MPLTIQIDGCHELTRQGLREPQLLQLASGDLLLTYHVQADMHFSERLGLRSRDGGRTWLPEPRRAHREQAIGRDGSRLVIAPDIYTFEREPGVYVGSYYSSSDDGATFTGPHESIVRVNSVASLEYPTPEHIPPVGHALRKFYQPLPAYYDPIVQRSSRRLGPAFWRNLVHHGGRWITAMQCRFHGDHYYRTILVASQDDGRSWSFVSTIAAVGDSPAPPGDGFCEPALVTAADGSLLCIMRRGSHLPLGQTRSYDGGDTWSEVELLAGHGVDPDLCLMRNGVLACTFGRPGQHIMFSEDGCGFAWGYRRVIGDWPGSCYMSIREVAPDMLLLVYDRAKDAPGAGRDPDRCHLGSTRIEVGR